MSPVPVPKSHQNSAGAGKAAKFVASNPLAPMADPFSGMDDDQKEMHKEVSDNVNTRLEKAMGDLKEKYSDGTGSAAGGRTDDDPDRAPTGHAYRAIAERNAREVMTRRAADELAMAEENRITVDEKERMRRSRFDDEDRGGSSADGGCDDSDDDDEFHDPELEAIRARRLQAMRVEQKQRAEDLSKGHGEIRTISQDDFLPECTGTSKYVAVHFFSDDFERCKILDHHLKIVAPLHVECKFLRIDAAKAPFFVHKLNIRTLPALIVFEDGKPVGRLTGFEGLVVDKSKPDDWKTGRLREWIAGTGAIRYEVPTEEVREEMKRFGIVEPRGAVWSGRTGGGGHGDKYPDDDEEY